jgi:hypothetical protein
MERRIFYIGVGLLIAAVAVLIINGYFASGLASGLQNILIMKNLTINSYNFSSIAISSTNSSYLFIIAAANKPVNMYLFNGSGFFNWQHYALPPIIPCPINATTNTATCTHIPKPSGLSRAIALEGKGAFVIFKNATNVTIPQSISSTTTPLYASNSTLYPPGTYYLVIDNTNGSASSSTQLQAKVVYLPPINNSSITSGPLSSFGSQLTQEIGLGIVFFILLIAGIAVLIYGFLRKPKDSGMPPPLPSKPRLKGEADREQVDQLYKDIEKREKAKKTKK